MTDELGATLAREYDGGATLAELAERHNLTYHRTRVLLVAAGATLRNVGPATPPAPPGLVAAYEGGATMKDLAARHGFSFGKVRRMLLAEGVVPAPKGGRAGTRNRRDG